MPENKKTYLSNGQILDRYAINTKFLESSANLYSLFTRPPVTVRANRFLESVYLFIGLYLVSFFSVCSLALAPQSIFSVIIKLTSVFVTTV